MNKADLDLYTDYLFSAFGVVTASGLFAMAEEETNHDQVTVFYQKRTTPQQNYGGRSSLWFA